MTALRLSANTGAMLALVLLALVPLSGAYADATYWIAAGGGALLGALIALAGLWWRWHILGVAAVTVVTYFAFGGALVFRSASWFGAVPTLDVLTSLALGVVQGWKQALTLQTPFGGFEQLGVVPYLTALVASVVAVSLAVRLRRWFGFAVLAPGALLIFSIAFSTYLGVAPGLTGAAWGGIALVWAVWRIRDSRARAAAAVPIEPGAETAAHAGRAATILGAGAVVVVAVLVGGASATAASVADREVLRDHVVPPVDLHDYASPMTSYRKYERDGADTRLFTVSGLPSGARIRLAALDLYDGVVYKVSGSGGAGSGVFARVGREIENTAAGEAATVTVRVEDLSGAWAPTIGYASGIAFEGPDAAEREDGLHYNAATGTVLVTTGLKAGDEYRLDAVVPSVPSEDELSTATISDVTTPAPTMVPDEIVSLLDEVVAGAESPLDQVRAIQAYFQTEGFFSSGLEGQVTSRSGHNLARESDLLGGTQMIGDDEQYAVAMALMVSQLGIPVRVVMGFVPEGQGDTVIVTGDDLHAWVEVPLDGLGWVAFAPTPSEDRVPQEETPQQSQKPQAQVAQPPQSPQEPAELPPTTPVEDMAAHDAPVDLAWLWATLQIAGMSLLVLAALFGPSAALAIARLRRRRRRADAASPVARVDGGWAELIDAAVDVGAPIAPGATRREHARDLEERYPGTGVAVLAVRADAAVFGAGDPHPDEVARYWGDIEHATRTMKAAVPWHRRVVAAMFPASVLRRVRLPRRRIPKDGAE